MTSKGSARILEFVPGFDEMSDAAAIRACDLDRTSGDRRVGPDACADPDSR